MRKDSRDEKASNGSHPFLDDLLCKLEVSRQGKLDEIIISLMHGDIGAGSLLILYRMDVGGGD
jgi:hypothetical protein